MTYNGKITKLKKYYSNNKIKTLDKKKNYIIKDSTSQRVSTTKNPY